MGDDEHGGLERWLFVLGDLVGVEHVMVYDVGIGCCEHFFDDL